MEFTEYQKAAYSTCTPACFTHEYLDLGYLSEVGELAGKLAKQIRGDRVCRDDIKGELGDIAWMIAVKALKDDERIVIDEDVEDELNWLFKCGTFDGNIYDFFTAFLEKFSGSLKFKLLIDNCERLKFDINDVLEYNRKKLASRKARGKINGSGDHR